MDGLQHDLFNSHKVPVEALQILALSAGGKLTLGHHLFIPKNLYFPAPRERLARNRISIRRPESPCLRKG
jgi:hypothetical protein